MVKQTIEINGETYLLQLGLDFLARLNELYTIDVNGLRLSGGLMRVFPELQFKNPVVIRDIIECATATNANRPSRKDIETWLFEHYEDEGKIDELFTTFFDLLEKQPYARNTAKAFKKGMEELKQEEAESSKAKKKTK